MSMRFDARIEDIMMFYQVVKHGSFLRAAQANNLCQGKISRRVAKLEEFLGVALFHTNMRSVIPTRAGKIVLKMAENILAATTQAQLDICNEYQELAGPITLSVATGFANFWLMPVLAEFLQLYPEITVCLQVNNLGESNTMMGETDIAVSTTRPIPRASLHSEVLCEYPLHLYGSEAYLARKGTPTCAQDLDHHDLIGWQEPLPPHLPPMLVNGLLYMGRDPLNPRNAYMEVDMDLTMITAVRDGIGLGFLPTFFGEAFPNIQRLPLSDVNPADYVHSKHITFLKMLHGSVKHQVLIAFIKERAQALTRTLAQSADSTA